MLGKQCSSCKTMTKQRQAIYYNRDRLSCNSLTQQPIKTKLGILIVFNKHTTIITVNIDVVLVKQQ